MAGKGESTSDRPRLDSVSGGGVMGGISNSSSPKLGVWNVCREKKTKKTSQDEINKYHLLSQKQKHPVQREMKVVEGCPAVSSTAEKKLQELTTTTTLLTAASV